MDTCSTYNILYIDSHAHYSSLYIITIDGHHPSSTKLDFTFLETSYLTVLVIYYNTINSVKYAKKNKQTLMFM